MFGWKKDLAGILHQKNVTECTLSLPLSIAWYMCVSLSIIKSALLVRTIFRIPSGPGSLYGFSFLSCMWICSAVIVPMLLHLGRYVQLARVLSIEGFAGKKPSTSMHPLSWFVLACTFSSLTLRFKTGILVLPPLPQGRVMSWCVDQISGSSPFSSQSLQWWSLVWSRIFQYFLDAALCTPCTEWSGLWHQSYACLPSLFDWWCSWVNSFVHHLLDFRVIFVTGTCISIVYWIAFVKLSQQFSKWSWLSISVGCGRVASWTLSSLWNLSQSMSQKLLISSTSMMSAARSSFVRIGRWSVLIPLWSVSVSQDIIKFSEWLDMKTWSNLLHSFVTLCLCVGVPLGSTKSRPASTTTSICFSAASNASLMNCLSLLGSSQYRWCLLKSPTHRICAVPLFSYINSARFLWWNSVSSLMVLSLLQSF